MDVASVNSAISFNPPVAGTTNTWGGSDRILTITTTNMTPSTQYTLTIQPTAKDKFDHPLDGDGNGTGGDAYVLNFRTKFLIIFLLQLLRATLWEYRWFMIKDRCLILHSTNR
ncbi:MAG: hypothetical protein IPN18_11370 [Ignavibacteriales bacterium]|nr:hypothetical protein [Ignavibacteriales bacterium]